jgi:hypothetical protein
MKPENRVAGPGSQQQRTGEQQPRLLKTENFKLKTSTLPATDNDAG